MLMVQLVVRLVHRLMKNQMVEIFQVILAIKCLQRQETKKMVIYQMDVHRSQNGMIVRLALVNMLIIREVL